MNSPVTKVELRLVENKIDTHIAEIDAWRSAQKELQEKNTANIAEVVAATQPLVDALIAVNAFHKFVKWCSGFAIVGAAAAWLSDKWPF